MRVTQSLLRCARKVQKYGDAFSKSSSIFKGRNPLSPTGEWLQCETISRWSLTTVWLNWTNGLLRLINSMVTELIRPVNYNPGRSQKLIKLEISFCRCSQLQCNEESGETEGYSALYTLLLPLRHRIEIFIHNKFTSHNDCKSWPMLFAD